MPQNTQRMFQPLNKAAFIFMLSLKRELGHDQNNFVLIVKQADKRSSVSRLCSTKAPSWRAIDSLEQDKKGFKL